MEVTRALGGRYSHWTEQAPQVFAFLRSQFGSAPSLNEEGADLVLKNGTRIEVKSALEWTKSTYSMGPRRRGRFVLHGYEEGDYFLFVLIRENGMLQLHLESFSSTTKRFGITGTINWARIFPKDH